jgi:hypothetical protein
MKTRTKKWARYRAKIQNTPSVSFSPRKRLTLSTNEGDQEAIAKTAVSKGAISLESVGEKKHHATPYAIYKRRKSIYLLLKIALLVIVVAGFVLFYIYWVR